MMERETWAAVLLLAWGRSPLRREETLAVTFYERSYTGTDLFVGLYRV